jgi:hypothetical protein
LKAEFWTCSSLTSLHGSLRVWNLSVPLGGIFENCISLTCDLSPSISMELTKDWFVILHSGFCTSCWALVMCLILDLFSPTWSLSSPL